MKVIPFLSALMGAHSVESVRGPGKSPSPIFDRIFVGFLGLAALFLPLLLVAIGFFLWKGATPAIHKFGWRIFTTSQWDPVQEIFGILPVIFGTITSSLLAVLMAGPVSVGVALFLNEIIPRRLRQILGFLVEMLAAIPSVVYGLWGIFVFAPFLRTYVEPPLGKTLGFLPLFSGPPYGVGMLAAAIILSIMIIPTICAVCREIFKAVPRNQREAVLALGATRWEMMKVAIVKSTKGGIFGAVILGLGRALGETMAVTMVIGNRAQISASLFAPSQTMASVLANEYAEATSDMHLSALVAVGLVLFIITLVTNGLARLLVWRLTGSKFSSRRS